MRAAGWLLSTLLTCVLALVAIEPVAAAEALHDPMRPAVRGAIRAPAAAEPVRRFRLESTVVGSRGNTAVINGRIYAQGERRGGVELVSVAPGRAVIRYRGELMQLKMRSATVRRSEGG